MVLHFNVTGETRKQMVKAAETELGVKAKYLGVPSCAYQVDIFTIGKDGTLSWEDMNDADPAGIEKSSRVVDACVMATGTHPTEWDENSAEDEEAGIGLTVSLPIEKVNVENLTALLEAKGNLIKKALGISDLQFTVNETEISFPWFTEVTAEESLTYTKFIAALCEMSMKQKRVTAKPKENENEKYSFRCFLLRLNFIGDAFKADRKILLANLEGSSAFKSKKEEQQ